MIKINLDMLDALDMAIRELGTNEIKISVSQYKSDKSYTLRINDYSSGNDISISFAFNRENDTGCYILNQKFKKAIEQIKNRKVAK